MNTLLEALAGQMGAIVSGAVSLTIGLLIWHLTNRSRDRVDRQVELNAFREQADALIVAVFNAQASVAMNSRLWEHPWEVVRQVCTVACVALGEAARTRVLGGTPWDTVAAGLGEAARTGQRERLASKTALAALRQPMIRPYEAAAPFLRHTDERVVQAATELLEATGDLKNSARLETALAAFGRAVAEASEPGPSRWRRLRNRISRRPAEPPQT